MRPRLWRVRPPEWAIGVCSAGLIVVLLATPWYSTGGASETGWESLLVLGPFVLVVGVLGIAVLWLQASCRSPALPVCATAFELLLSFCCRSA